MRLPVILAHETRHAVESVEPHQSHELNIVVSLAADQVDGPKPGNAARFDTRNDLPAHVVTVLNQPGGTSLPAPSITHRPPPASSRPPAPGRAARRPADPEPAQSNTSAMDSATPATRHCRRTS